MFTEQQFKQLGTGGLGCLCWTLRNCETIFIEFDKLGVINIQCFAVRMYITFSSCLMFYLCPVLSLPAVA